MDVREGLQLYAGVRHHLLYNIYPPAKMSFIDPAINAIQACWEGEPERPIEVPDGFFCKAEDLVELFRLEFYTEAEEEW